MEKAAMELFLPCMETAMVIAGHYAKSCGRDTVVSQDVRYGLMFAARHVLGKQIGSLFPEVYEDEEDEEDDEEDEEDEEDDEWTSYEGDDERLVLVNKCADEWDSWEPETPAEFALKNAVDSVGRVPEP